MESTVPVILTPQPAWQEQVSLAFLSAVVAGAGCQLTLWPQDYMGVDASIAPVKGVPVQLDVQLKSTIKPKYNARGVAFDLDIRSYDLLRIAGQVPRILILVILPDEKDQWVSVDADGVIIRREAYWVSLKGQPISKNRVAQRVHLPLVQKIDSSTIVRLIQTAHDGLLKGRVDL